MDTQPDVRPFIAEQAGAAEAADFHDPLPRVGGPAGYIGSGECQSCHEDQYASWHRSYHRTMTQVASRGSVRADFQHVQLTNDTTRFVLTQTNDAFWVRMERLDLVQDGGGPVPALEVRIGLVSGSHHMQVFWVGDEGHGCQIGFPFTWLLPEKRWVPRNSTFIRPPDFEHRPETWNHVCARCHATGSEPNLDRISRTWHTEVGELGIACEACHGPGQRHADQQRALGLVQPETKSKPTNLFIVHPEKLAPARASQICGFCHSMKWWDRNEGWPERGFRYRPGNDLESTTPIIRPNRIESQPWLKSVLQNNPEIFRDFFWSDGMIRVSGREYNGLIESPCYAGGKFSCLSCHSLHESDPDDQLAKNRRDNRGCTQCHSTLREANVLAAHSHHSVQSSGSQCYNCHMPHTTYGVLKAIRSHQISRPSVATQLATGRPNACNLCHIDKSLTWTADHLNRWFNQPIPQLSTNEVQIAAAVRLALSGDAGQRALLAWHLGWEPAWQAGGKSWIPPILGMLLDDPYAAVRCVAARSLKSLGNWLPQNYDYTVPPDSRLAAKDSVIEKWRASMAAARPNDPRGPALVDWQNPVAMQTTLEALIRLRDNRPVRLRE